MSDTVGTEIIFYVEEYRAGEWHCATPVIDNPDYELGIEGEPKKMPQEIDVYINSCLCAVLANVRNGRKSCGGELKFISMPRGLPDDLSSIIREYYESFDAFAASWLYLEEILKFNWSKKVQLFGKVHRKAAHLFRKNPLGFPWKDWPKDIRVSYSVGDCFNSDLVDVKWRETYESATSFKNIKPNLIKYQKNTPNTVRFVFWFYS